MHEEVTLVQLTREAFGGHLPALIELDAEVRAEFGIRYSGERWGEQEFERDLPGKWDLSVVALDDSDTVCGFVIVSVKEDTTLHIHRFAVKASHRGRAVASALVRTAAKAGAARGLDRMAVFTNHGNAAGLGFYLSLGFQKAATAAIDHWRLEVNLRSLAQV